MDLSKLLNTSLITDDILKANKFATGKSNKMFVRFGFHVVCEDTDIFSHQNAFIKLVHEVVEELESKGYNSNKLATDLVLFNLKAVTESVRKRSTELTVVMVLAVFEWVAAIGESAIKQPRLCLNILTTGEDSEKMVLVGKEEVPTLSTELLLTIPLVVEGFIADDSDFDDLFNDD